MDGAALAALVQRFAPDHAAHKHEAALDPARDAVDVRCSCGVGLTFSALMTFPGGGEPQAAKKFSQSFPVYPVPAVLLESTAVDEEEDDDGA